MGTNYYLETDVCPCCKVAKDRKHIGKSSVGWCFSLHVIPGEGIIGLSGWQKLFAQANTVIKNEYGDILEADDMVKYITNRKWRANSPGASYLGHEDFHRLNHSLPGPNNCLRHVIDNVHCVGHGLGTWDLIAGEFS